jgi:hypothetical protein
MGLGRGDVSGRRSAGKTPAETDQYKSSIILTAQHPLRQEAMHDIADVLEVQYCAQYLEVQYEYLPTQRHLSEPNKPRSVSRRRRVSQYCILGWHSGMRQNAAGYLVASSTEMQAPAW